MYDYTRAGVLDAEGRGVESHSKDDREWTTHPFTLGKTITQMHGKIGTYVPIFDLNTCLGSTTVKRGSV